jgi:FSR family fosmidomycin resistance protein-like MFS transporter
MADSKPATIAGPAPVLLTDTSERSRPNVRLIAQLALGHFVIDSYLPRSPGMASGLIVGFAMGAGGLGVTVLGWVADRHGVPAALWISALTPLAAFVAARFLPAPRERA